MLFAKGTKLVIAVEQIGRHGHAVVVAIDVDAAEQGVSLVGRKHVADTIVRSQKQDGRSLESLLARLGIHAHQFRALEYRVRGHPTPRMSVSRHLLDARQQVEPHVLFRHVRENPLLGKDVLLPNEKLRKGLRSLANSLCTLDMKTRYFIHRRPST